MITQEQLNVRTLGPCRVLSPYASGSGGAWATSRFVPDDEKIRFRVELEKKNEAEEGLTFEKAGPRERIFFHPEDVVAGIVTCGGLSPGLNNVINSLVLELWQNYGVRRIVGFHHGYLGFRPDAPVKPRALTLEDVRHISGLAGSILGSSRGPVEPSVIVDSLVAHKINVLFAIGGDGTQRGAHAIVEEIDRRKLAISLIGIPKTIDNDVAFVWRTFGFATAVEKAAEVIAQASAEVRAYPNSVAIVKLMGRDAGFISAMATLAAQDVDFTLIPEVPFTLEGERGLLAAVEAKLAAKGSALIVVSEGAGQEFFKDQPSQYDLSGNRLQNDIGAYLKERIGAYLAGRKITAAFRYFDPSYSVRAVRANVVDALFCNELARAAVHAAMAGKTDMLVGLWFNNLTHVPIPLVCSVKKRISPEQETWRSVLAVTGQRL